MSTLFTTKQNEVIIITDRELDVLKLLVEGKTNPEIGEELFISYHTVKAALEKLYGKTGCHNRVQLVIFTIKNEIIN